MTAYMIVRVDVKDMEQYKEYTRLTPAILEKYGAKFIARGGDVLTLEGDAETRRIVLVEFESVEQAQKFYESPEYQAAKAVRDGAADAQFIVVEGV